MTSDHHRLLSVVRKLMEPCGAGVKTEQVKEESMDEDDTTVVKQEVIEDEAEGSQWCPEPFDKIMPSGDLKFCHDSIRHQFRKGESFEDLLAKLKEKGPGWPLTEEAGFLHLEAVQWSGCTFSISNRRTYCLRQHQQEVDWTVRVRVKIWPLPVIFERVIGAHPVYMKSIRGYTTRDGRCPRKRPPPPKRRRVVAADSCRPDRSGANVTTCGRKRCYMMDHKFETLGGKMVMASELSVGSKVLDYLGNKANVTWHQIHRKM